MPMRIFYVLKNTSIENLRHIFPPSNKMTLSTKMSPPPLPLQNHFLFSPRRPSTQNPQAEPLIKYQKETQSHKRHTKSKQKKQFQHHRSKKSKEKPSKRQSKTIHQTPPTRKYPTQTAIQIQQTPSQIPLRNHTPQNARTFPLKRKCISLQTPKSSLPNASAFHLKHKDV